MHGLRACPLLAGVEPVGRPRCVLRPDLAVGKIVRPHRADREVHHDHLTQGFSDDELYALALRSSVLGGIIVMGELY